MAQAERDAGGRLDGLTSEERQELAKKLVEGIMKTSERSFEKITDEDLKKLASLAAEDRRDFLSRKPQYTGDFLCSALCQGGALQFVDGKNGVKDFDVWSFYAEKKGVPPFPPRNEIS